jgi:hypothetical protein
MRLCSRGTGGGGQGQEGVAGAEPATASPFQVGDGDHRPVLKAVGVRRLAAVPVPTGFPQCAHRGRVAAALGGEVAAVAEHVWPAIQRAEVLVRVVPGLQAGGDQPSVVRALAGVQVSVLAGDLPGRQASGLGGLGRVLGKVGGDGGVGDLPVACNAENTSGCGSVTAKIKIGVGPGPPEVNPATSTMYVTYTYPSENKIAVVNTATCNAENTTGCGQTPAVVKVGPGTEAAAVSTRFNTVYAPSAVDNNVALINGATCDGTDHAGCGHLAGVAKVGADPFGLAIDDATHTVYVANGDFDDLPSTVSVIDAATCNATDTTGCTRPFPVTPAGHGPIYVAVDTSTNTVYVADNSNAAVTVFNGARCDATTTSGCATAGRLHPIAFQPVDFGVDTVNHTVYVTVSGAPGNGMPILRTG